MADRLKYSSPAVEKAFAVVELISLHPEGLRMTDIVDRLELPKTSTFVMLRSLEQMGYLMIDSSNRYRLTLRLFELGVRAMNQVDIISLGRPFLERLVDKIGLTAHLASLEGSDAVYLARTDAPGLIRFDTFVGKRAPAHLTAVGKAILAYLPGDELDALLPTLNLAAGTDRAVHSARALRHELAEIREAGYAVEDGEEVEGVRCVAAPIQADGKRVVASVGVIQLRSQLGDERLPAVAAELMQTARSIAQLLMGEVSGR